MERRRLVGGVALAGLVAALVTAWRPAEPPADFVFVNGTEPKSLDPHLVTGQPEGRLVSALFERLVDWDPHTLEVRPGLAERWEVEEGATRLVFHLRSAAWSDGVPITAATVRDSWRRLLDPATAAEYSYQLFPVKGAEAFATGRETDFDSVGLAAPDDRTFVVELARPTPYFLHVCGFYPLAPVPLHAIARHGSPGWTKPGRLVSSGPYRLVLRRLRDRVRLVRNESHHEAASVRLGTIDCLAVESSTTALALYETAAVDWTPSLPPFAARELVARAAPDMVTAPELTIGFYRLNTTRPPLDDRRVRRALSLALDRERIVQAVYGPGQRPSRSFVPAGLSEATGYEPATTADTDVEAARRLLAEAGFPEGRGFPRITISFNADEGHQMVAELVQARWRDVLGIEAALESMEWGSFLDAQSRLDYWVGRAGWVADYVDPNTFLDLFVGGGANNQTGFSSAAYDDLVARAGRAADAAGRNRLFHEAETILMDELPVIPLFTRSSRNLVAPWVKGFPSNPLDWHPLECLDVDPAARAEARRRARVGVGRVGPAADAVARDGGVP
jgi:oligopeptide transport system substrate-binding protein